MNTQELLQTIASSWQLIVLALAVVAAFIFRKELGALIGQLKEFEFDPRNRKFEVKNASNKAKAQRKGEGDRSQEQQRHQSKEESERKADEEKERSRAQSRPRITAYDVFISFKNLDERGVPTRDAQLANEVYNFLRSKGLSVFISTVTLESLGVSNYKKAIDDALDAASIMVAVGTSTENLNSEWVRYEWDGFYNDILSKKKPGGKVFAYISGLRPAELPRALRQTQAFNSLS
jgi:hypothetical protein